MYTCMTWKQRPISPEQDRRMMDTWGKLEAAMAENPSFERVCWFLYADGSGGLTVNKIHDPDAAAALELEVTLALSEFIEFESHTGLDLDTAMPAILKAVERINS